MRSRILLVAGVLPLQSVAQQPVSSGVFDKIARYTAFAAASYSDDCPQPPNGTTIVKTFNDAATDTQATLFRDTSANEVVIAFRGTSSPQDLDSDLTYQLVPLAVAGASCSSCKVHQGFQTSYNAIAGQVLSAVKSELSSGAPRLIVTGHSLGAGIAAIAATSFVGQGVRVAETYTFGEPRNGDPQWAGYVSQQLPDANYFRITHYNDGVPQIPPPLLGYAHHGAEYWQRESKVNTAQSTVKCPVESTVATQTCNAGQDFGSNPINGAHLTYSNTLIGSSLFVPACGAVFP
ncbi:ferulic acid esterase A faeA [Moelleriella libera RCEF 2490]|uniref:Ferulic acid esterase A faeA n=1 Tax=Moelleriella libera RCEF 2490 TaxID=1081109 RepID=A0A168ASZ1_9HYPO|nr:ferulic acid esterase A faeA [Moelleriella libera RCEF 2490]